jgi:hypothetical protein
LGTPPSATNSVPLSLVLFSWGAWEAGHVNYRPGADRCSVAGTGVGAGSLKILAGVLVHRATRPLRGSVLRGSGWSVPCVSIQLTLSQHFQLSSRNIPRTPSLPVRPSILAAAPLYVSMVRTYIRKGGHGGDRSKAGLPTGRRRVVAPQQPQQRLQQKRKNC